MSVNSDGIFFGILTNQEYDIEHEKVETVRKHITYLPHPQLSQSVFTVFYDEMRMYYIPNLNELTDT